MASEHKNSGIKPDRRAAWRAWNEANPAPILHPEQIVEWLDQYREMMFEVWRANPELRRQWEKLNDWRQNP